MPVWALRYVRERCPGGRVVFDDHRLAGFPVHHPDLVTPPLAHRLIDLPKWKAIDADRPRGPTGRTNLVLATYFLYDPALWQCGGIRSSSQPYSARMPSQCVRRRTASGGSRRGRNSPSARRAANR